MATDTFARFLDVLAEALDDHEAGAADLAARVHLSRYHLSRVVTATAGEPPAQLRRRLLLERAAYRLVGQLEKWLRWMNLRHYDFGIEQGETLEHMTERLNCVGPAFLGQVREACEQARLGATFVDVQCEPPRVFTYGGMIAHVLTFAAHRRTIVAGALVDAGVPELGDGDPMEWMAQWA